ncbi:hypothetical protein PsYK624_168710 [Phanerochaete sordida]|uniref:Uncharacterized protein n=1 Tax=Phanerochaete sordida TaxID=48140 RepID=A0A9P3GRL0_9APHY|nr:hypothetical protein PsYK624_168710 [Phanerochaete sordida]
MYYTPPSSFCPPTLSTLSTSSRLSTRHFRGVSRTAVSADAQIFVSIYRWKRWRAHVGGRCLRSAGQPIGAVLVALPRYSGIFAKFSSTSHLRMFAVWALFEKVRPNT